ncbi:MAG: hypothetical protein KME25_00595 [Symplocastrum torsivum CPER-KK1]|jgi:glycerol-3-phosphate cytidylyltransferase-like family protein|uniref:Uncharacterized protein n=1 Tax=Symplocastrum torsivum CPER-KK1 TaxID=450513 RepID=A0A951U797_9CYAN|nr:hypothetical protein [Symplocastrum torsivum CPER-KK1]
MDKLIKKVDRVSTIEEAIQLQDCGVEIISISISGDPKFNDNRVITEEAAIEIRKMLKTSKSVAEILIENNWNKTIDLIEKIGIDYVQPLGNQIPHRDFRKELYKKGIGIIYSNIEASYDDDPSWILSSFVNEDNLNSSYYQIDLLGNMENSWEFFKEECPKYPEELQIHDINELAKQYPLLITLDYSPDNILEIINLMPNIKGITMVLGDDSLRNDIHYFKYSEVLNILDKLSIPNLGD